MMELTQIKETADLIEYWPVSTFIESYKKYQVSYSNICACSLAAINSEPGCPDKTTVITFRVFIERSKRANIKQKYILALKFYNFGDFATLDLISLDLDYHRDIVKYHQNAMHFSLLSEYRDKVSVVLEDNIMVPLLLSGGYLNFDSKNKICFFGESKDYSDSMFFSKSNSVSEFIMENCGLNFNQNKPENSVKQGKYFTEKILEFMLRHKKSPKFYETFVGFIMKKFSDPKIFTSQQLNALMMMKVFDRHINEKKDEISLIIEEVAGGFGRHVMITSVAENMKRSKNN